MRFPFVDVRRGPSRVSTDGSLRDFGFELLKNFWSIEIYAVFYVVYVVYTQFLRKSYVNFTHLCVIFARCIRNFFLLSTTVLLMSTYV